MNSPKMLRLPDVLEITGDKPSSFHAKVAAGLFVSAVKNGPRCVSYPKSEVVAITNARIAGRSEDEIRALVQRLMAARKLADQDQDVTSHAASYPSDAHHQASAPA